MENIAKYEAWMRRCIQLGQIAKARGDSPVGCLIVENDKIIAEGTEAGRTKQDITCHAEIEAIRAARKSKGTDLSDCILVTTHEPCIMCSYVIRHHKIKAVISGVSTGEIGGYSSSLPVLRTNDIKRWGPSPLLITGILEADCLSL